MITKRKEYMIGVLPKRKILMLHGESQYSVNGTRHGLGPSRRRAPPPCDR